MKTSRISLFISVLTLAILSAFPLAAQETEADSTGLPGDNFNLEAALDLFKKSDSPEDFEKRLNEKQNDANNLDLNEDGDIDYIRVVDKMDGDVHALVLQVPVSESESQDVAVIEIEKTGAETAVLQIVGDVDVFGEQKIAEPFEEEKTNKKGRGGPALGRQPLRIVVNVWVWPSVRFVYRPGYVAYVSPWRWRAYPTWWRPWRPFAWTAWHVRHRPYRAHFHVVTVHRVPRAHAVYVPARRHSAVVHTRTTTVKTTGPHGKVTHTKTTKTTTVKGKNGKVAKQKTTKTTTRRRRG